MKNKIILVKYMSIIFIVLSLILLGIGLYTLNNQQPKTTNYSDPLLQQKFEERKPIISLCKHNSWKQFILIDDTKTTTLNNNNLFQIFTSKTENSGRHKSQNSVALKEFFNKNTEVIKIQACSGQIYSYNRDKIESLNPRLVLNQKGALKLIINENNGINVISKYLYSVSISP